MNSRDSSSSFAYKKSRRQEKYKQDLLEMIKPLQYSDITDINGEMLALGFVTHL